MDRQPPQDVEAEIAVLGSMLLDPDAAGRVAALLKKEDFYRGPHGDVFEVLAEIYDAHRAIDIVLLREELQRRSLLDKVGGTTFLSQIVASVPTAANAEHYARIVRDCALRRAVISASNEVEKQAYDGALDGADLVDFAESRFFELDRNQGAGEPVHIRDVLKSAFEQIDQNGGANDRAVKTGFYDLDDKTNGGLTGGQLIIVAGRPAMGKTTFCLNIAEHASVTNGESVALFSLEMSRDELVTRVMCSRGRVDMSALKKGVLQDADWARLAQAVGRLDQANMFIDDTPALSPLLLRTKARRLKAQHDIGLIVVDYIQLMEAPNRGRDSNRQAEIAYISRSLKGIARELDVPVIALSQLNRAVDSREDHRPRMSDLRESGAIEQDADVIMFLFRESWYMPDGPDKDERARDAEVIISKQRNGPTGTVRLQFMAEYLRFENAAEEPRGGYAPPM